MTLVKKNEFPLKFCIYLSFFPFIAPTLLTNPFCNEICPLEGRVCCWEPVTDYKVAVIQRLFYDRVIWRLLLYRRIISTFICVNGLVVVI